MKLYRLSALSLALFGSSLSINLAQAQPALKQGGRSAGAVAAEDAYFAFDAPPRKDLFIIKLTDPAKIQKARDLLSGKTSSGRHVSGLIVKEPACYNPPWSYHLDPQSITFFDSSVEVCDGAMGYIESYLSEVGGALLPGSVWCPWGSRLVKEVPAPVCNDGVKSFSGASYRRAGLAGESIVAAYGSGLANTTETAKTTPLPTTLGGTTVRIRDGANVERLAPLFFVSPGQVNYLVPPGAEPGLATVTVTNADNQSAGEETQVLTVAPGVFTANSDGSGAPAALALRVKADGSQRLEPVFRFDPAEAKFIPAEIDLGPDQGKDSDQVFLVLFGTGLRGVDPGLIGATVGGELAEILFVGASPGFAGVDQANIRLNRALIGRGETTVVLQADDQAANQITIRIK
jgi:hypothetical protein